MRRQPQTYLVNLYYLPMNHSKQIDESEVINIIASNTRFYPEHVKRAHDHYVLYRVWSKMLENHLSRRGLAVAAVLGEVLIEGCTCFVRGNNRHPETAYQK